MKEIKFKKISDYLDKRLILCNAVKEPINKDLDCAIRLSVAYEDLYQRIDKAIDYIEKLGYLAELSKESFIVEESERKQLLSILKGNDK